MCGCTEYVLFVKGFCKIISIDDIANAVYGSLPFFEVWLRANPVLALLSCSSFLCT